MPLAALSVPCRCRARPGQPCTALGNHLARYLAAELAGVISRDQLKAEIGTLTVLAPHVVVIDQGDGTEKPELREVHSP